MRAVVDEKEEALDEDLLFAIRSRVPLVEATIDLLQGKLVAIAAPPPTARWGGLPTPLY